jgi:DNA-binding MarR family transcriptional regulator
MERDIVDLDLDEWVDNLPGVDLSGRHILWRLAFLNKLIDRRIEQMSRKDGLSGSGFKLMLTLLRNPPEHQLSPGQLARQGSLTSGTITVLIDQLEERDLVQRRPDPRDRRALLVRLTPEGKQLIEEAHQAYLIEEHEILRALDASDREQLTNLLRKLLLSLDDRR